MLSPLLLSIGLLTTAIALPGGAPVAVDYVAFDAINDRIWVPAGNAARVDVIDAAAGKVTPVPAFTGNSHGGPSSVTVGEQVVWVGSRAEQRVCPFDRRTLAPGACVQLAAMPDGIAYVIATRELWVTTPRDKSITIVGVAGKTAAAPATIKLDGRPEGYAVDGARQIFYTNLEDRDRTIAIDVKTRKVVATYTPGCGSDGPRGLAIDSARRTLFVACTSGAALLDLAHDGKVTGRLKTGGGVDNLDYYPPSRLLYVASAKAGTLTIAHAGDDGLLSVVATKPTAKGARNPVVDGKGNAYVPDSAGGRMIVIENPAP